MIHLWLRLIGLFSILPYVAILILLGTGRLKFTVNAEVAPPKVDDDSGYAPPLFKERP